MKLGWLGVIETYLPPYYGSLMSYSKTAPISFSILILSYLVIAPGSGYLLRFLPVLTLIERAGKPNFVKSKFPSAGKSLTSDKFQLLVWLLTLRLTLWYYSRALAKNGLNSS